MTFSTRNFDPLTPLAPKFPNFAPQILLFRLKHCCRRHTCTCATKFFLTTWELGVACQKTTFRTKIGGELARGASKKFGTPYTFLQPLKLATSNLVHKLGLGLAYQKTTFWTIIGGGLSQGSSQEKFGTPYVFLQPLKPASNLVHRKQRFGPKLAGVWAKGASKKVGTPTYFCNRWS